MLQFASLRSALGAALALACVSTDVDPIADPAFAPEEDEAALWSEAAQIDAKLAERGLVLRDAEVEGYLEDVAQRLLAGPATAPLPARVRVLLDPYANAFALPNGSVYLHSGLLAPMVNEAQLATVLGHELTHYTARHGLQEHRAQANLEKARDSVAVTFALITAAATGDPYAARILSQGTNDLAGQIMRLQLAGYSRELEGEADARALAMMRAAGYDPLQAIALFELLIADADATEAQIPYVYASHPKIQERIESVEELLETEPPQSGALRTNEDEFQQRTASVLLANARLELATGAVVPAERALERYTRLVPADPAGVRVLAEAYRRAGPEPEHVARAAMTLERAAALQPDDAETQRELGLLYRELDDRDNARSRLARYLALAPDAADRGTIERYVAELQ
jgi:predicted Zn-dependent protease